MAALTFRELYGGESEGQNGALVTPGRATDGTFLVDACGRHLNVPLQSGSTLLGLQSVMQDMLQMKGQNFIFSDSTGAALRSNNAIFEAVQQGRLPISATLSDASIHAIENRREELAQMQWKLVRDKMNGMESDTAMLGRQVTELKDQLAAVKEEAAEKMKMLQADISRAVEDKFARAQANCGQVSENVTSLAHLLQVEKENRSSALQHVQHQIQELHQILGNEQNIREKQFEQNLLTLREGKVALEAQKELHRSLEQQTTFERDTMRTELQNLAKHFNALDNDQLKSFRQTMDAVAAKVLQNSNELARLATLDEKFANQLNLISAMEGRYDVLDRRLSETSMQQAERFDRISDRQEKVGALLDENLREVKIQQCDFNTITDRVRVLEEVMIRNQDETIRFIQQEGISVRHEIHRSKQQITQDHGKNLSDLHSKVMDRLEMESANREERTRQLQENITNVATRNGVEDNYGSTTSRSPAVSMSVPAVRVAPAIAPGAPLPIGVSFSPAASPMVSPRAHPLSRSRAASFQSVHSVPSAPGGSISLPVFAAAPGPGSPPVMPVSPRAVSPRRIQQASPQGYFVFQP